MTDEGGATYGQTRGFLFADLRGYTAFVERRGDDAAAALLERYRTLVRGALARQAGAEVKTEGDSFYVLFPSASSAVAAGLDIVASAAADAAEHPDAPIRVGVGIHAGETSDLPEGPVGSAVNMAARICAQAGAGEVLVSDTVRGLTRTRNVAAFASVGSRKLKGIAEPVLLYRAAPPGTVVTGRSSRVGKSSVPMTWIGAGALLALVLIPASWIIATALGGADRPTPGPTQTLAANGSSPSPTFFSSPAPSTLAPASRIVFSHQVAIQDNPDDPYDVDCNSFNDAKLYAVDPSGQSEPYRISGYTNLFEFDPSWSADGNLIAFLASVQNRGSDVLVSQLPWTEPLRLNMGARPQISADGSEVLVVIEDRFEIARSDGSSLDAVVLMDEFGEAEPSPLPSPLQIEGPLLDGTWGPDGHVLLVPPVAFNPDGPSLYKIELRDRDGNNPITLPIEIGELLPLRLALSPDGQTLALALADPPVVDQETPLRANGIYVVPMTGGQPSRLTPEGLFVRDLAWAPDGHQIAFTAGDLGATQIWRVSADGGAGPTQVTHLDNGFACGATWQTSTSAAVAPPARPSPGQPAIFERGVLAAGRYLISESQPNVELTIPSGFWSRRNYVDGFSIAQVGGEGLAELDSALITVAFTGPCRDDPTTIVGPTARDVVAWLQTRADLDVAAPVPVNLGGYHGLSAEITLKEGCPAESQPGSELAYLFPSGQDIYHIVTDERIKIIVVDVRGAAVSILVDAIGAAYEPFAEAVQPILDSMSFPE